MTYYSSINIQLNRNGQKFKNAIITQECSTGDESREILQDPSNQNDFETQEAQGHYKKQNWVLVRYR